MASQKDVKAGGAFVELSTKNSALLKGLAAASKTLKSWGKAVSDAGSTMMKFGLAAMAPMLHAVHAYETSGDAMAKASKRTGISVERLSELAFAADLSGVSMESLEKALKGMLKMLVEAASGGAEAQEALANLGIDVQQLANMRPEERFLALADQLSKVTDPTVRAALAMKVFGKTGNELLPMLEGGAAGIAGLMAQAHRLGLTMSTESAAAAEDFNDRMTELWKVLGSAYKTIGAALVPMLREYAVKLRDGTVWLKRWIGDHREVVRLAFLGATGLAATGVAVWALGKAVSYAGTAFGLLGSVIKLAVGAVGFFVSPVGIVIGLLGALAAWLLYSTEVGQKALGALGDAFAILREDAARAWRGIADALAAGDIKLAAQILWATLQLEWGRGINVLSSLWENFRMYFVKVAAGAFYGALAAWEFMTYGLRTAWNETAAFIKSTWAELSAWLSKTWSEATGEFSQGWIEIQRQWNQLAEADPAKREAKDEELRLRQNKARNQITTDATNIEEERKRRRAEIEDQRKQTAESNDKKLDETLSDIGTKYNDLAKGAEAVRDENIKRSEAELEALKKERDALLAKAKAGGDSARGKAKEPEMPQPPKMPDFGKTADSLGDLGAKVESRGTFSAAALQSLQSSPMNAIRKNTKDTADAAKKTVEKLQQVDATILACAPKFA